MSSLREVKVLAGRRFRRDGSYTLGVWTCGSAKWFSFRSSMTLVRIAPDHRRALRYEVWRVWDRGKIAGGRRVIRQGDAQSGRYLFYDSARRHHSIGLQEIYRFAYWGKSRTIDQIARMLPIVVCGFSVPPGREGRRLLLGATTSFFRALLGLLVHPDHQGKGIGSALIDYALNHPPSRISAHYHVYARSDLLLERHGLKATKRSDLAAAPFGEFVRGLTVPSKRV